MKIFNINVCASTYYVILFNQLNTTGMQKEQMQNCLTTNNMQRFTTLLIFGNHKLIGEYVSAVVNVFKYKYPVDLFNQQNCGNGRFYL